MRANCAHCRWFVPWSELTEYEQELALAMAHHMGKSPDEVKGWCRLLEIPITHYKGYCRHYQPNKEPPKPNQTLDKWLFGVRE